MFVAAPDTGYSYSIFWIRTIDDHDGWGGGGDEGVWGGGGGRRGRGEESAFAGQLDADSLNIFYCIIVIAKGSGYKFSQH